MAHRPSRSKLPSAGMARVLSALGASLAIGLLAAGCGSSGSSSTTAAVATKPAAPALTKAEFIAKANAICASGNTVLKEKREGLEKMLGGHSPSLTQLSEYVTTGFVPAIQAQISAIRALGSPPGETARVTHLLAVAEEDLQRVKNNPALLLPGAKFPFESFVKLIRPYGITTCASKA